MLITGLSLENRSKDDPFLLKFGFLENSEHTMARQNNKKKTQTATNTMDSDPGKQICCFCGLAEENELEFGKFYEHSGYVTHYYCLLLSSNMEQKGNDDEGILGFLAEDIGKEIRRGRRLVCSYCKKNGATLGCCNAKCKRIFHFPCGLKAGSLHQFFGEFRSYCINHRPKQKIDDRVKKEIASMSNILCYICYEDVEPLNGNDTLWAPCCKKNAWFHRKCVQQLAMSAGYFFKCPLCNNKREFQTAMLEYGIYIPRQDASWELVPNAFEELLYRHDHCDAQACICPKGRTYTSSNGKWELVLCRMCGSQGMHISCGRLNMTNPIWDCQECIKVIKKPPENMLMTDESTSNSSEAVTQIENTTLNVTIREFDEDSDSDISVGNESVPLESDLNNIPAAPLQVKLRPGPRSFKLQQVQKLQRAEGSKEDTNKIGENSSNSNLLSNIISKSIGGTSVSSTVTSKVSSEVICIDSEDEAVEVAINETIICESAMRNTARRSPISQTQTVNGACSSSSSTELSNPILANAIRAPMKAVLPMNFASTEYSTVIVPPLVEDTDDSPFNIIISNVTSVAPEFFANVPETSEEEEPLPEPTIEAVLGTSNQLKRHHSSDDIDCEIVAETTKRARLEDTNQWVNPVMSASLADITRDDRLTIAGLESLNTASLPIVKQSPSKTAAVTSTALVGSSGAASSSLENCHGDAGTRPAVVDTSRSCIQDRPTFNGTTVSTATIAATAATTAAATTSTSAATASAATAAASPALEGVLDFGTTTPDADIYSTSNSELTIRTVLENGSTSHCSSSSGSSASSKSGDSFSDRSRLMPDRVRLGDLKFKIHGDDLELLYGRYKVQVKMNFMLNSATSKDASNGASSSSVSPYASSHQNLSSEKSSKSFQMRSDDSSESYRNLKSLRARSLRNFVYEDDNTLLEYPTSASESQNNVKIVKKSSMSHDSNVKVDRNDLKENLNPEVMSSSNNTFDNSNNNNNNNQINSLDLKGSNNFREISIKSDDVITESTKEESDTNHRLLRRSNRIVRHFRSVQQSNVMQNGQVNGDSADSNTNGSFSSTCRKSNQTVISDQPIKNSRSLKVLNSPNFIEKDKHLKNVGTNGLKLALTGKVKDTTNNNNDIDEDVDFKISIDLQKISNLISAKPDLFFKMDCNDVRRLRVYKVDEKLRVEFKAGEKKFLTKSQSFDCLLNLTKNNSSFYQGRSKSLNDLSNLDSKTFTSLTDQKDCIEKKGTRRSRRRKTKQFEKHECVR